MTEPRDLYLEQNFNCSESIMRAANSHFQLGLDENAMRSMGGFGGGMGAGYACGALCSCIAVISALFSKGKAHETAGFKELCASFVQEFEADIGHRDCLSIKKDHFKDDGTRCAYTVQESWRLLEDFISRHR